MRLIKLLFLFIVAVALITMGFANRDIVTLTLLPADMAQFAGFNYAVTVPLYFAIFGGIVIGLLLGFIWEWLREGKHRDAAVRERRHRAQLEAENKKLKAEKNSDKDEVLVLLDENAPAR